MAQPDQASSAESRVSYLRGVLDGEKLTADQRLELALSTFVEVAERIIGLVAQVMEEQSEIKRMVGELRAEQVQGAGTRPASDTGDGLSCPQCAQRLAVSPDALGRGPIEVTCPECRLVLEII